MAKKESELATNIKLGTRVRHIEDGALGRIIWANAAAVKIQWDDGEKVTWKRSELGIKGLAVVQEETPEELATEATSLATEPTPAREPESTAAVEAIRTPASEETPAEPATTEPTVEPAQESAAPDQTTEAAPAKKRRPRSAKPESGSERKPSALDAAARILAEEHRPMGCQELIGAMAAKGYWTSPGGKTPAATLYSALLREIDTKGDAARFVKTGRGTFALRPQA
jgi:hypothetical protein